MLEQNLNELNIFALRDFARRTGVSSPTSKKKEVLIKEIVEIVSGKKQPTQAKTKQGRPPKLFGYNFANVFSVEEQQNEDSSYQTLKQNEVNYEDKEISTLAGWLELLNNNSALMWVEKDFNIESYFIPREIIENVPVKMGDRVVAEVDSDENIKVVKNIFSLNDVPITKLNEKRKEYQNFQHVLPFAKIDFENSEYLEYNLLKGENIYLYGSDNNNNTKLIVDLFANCKIKNKIYINVTVAEKNKIYLEKIKYFEKFVSKINEDEATSKRLLFLAAERVKRIFEQGEDVLLVIDDVASIAEIDGKAIKNLISLTKNTKKEGSITIIAIMPNSGMYQIEKLADVRFEILGSKLSKKII